MNIVRDAKAKNDMDRVVAGLTTKSDMIRALDKAGYKRADIARYLGIRYQHVRNVLVASERAKTSADDRGTTDAGEKAMVNPVWGQVGPDGRAFIPAAFRQKLGLENGGPVLMMLENGELRLLSRDAAIAQAQALVAKYVPKKASLVDALLADRRREVERETADG